MLWFLACFVTFEGIELYLDSWESWRSTPKMVSSREAHVVSCSGFLSFICIILNFIEGLRFYYENFTLNFPLLFGIPKHCLYILMLLRHLFYGKPSHHHFCVCMCYICVYTFLHTCKRMFVHACRGPRLKESSVTLPPYSLRQAVLIKPRACL